jgi:hypothetical protein
MWTKKHEGTAKGFMQLGHDVKVIICGAYQSFIFGGPNSVGQ